jgi:hypothetical protein
MDYGKPRAPTEDELNELVQVWKRELNYRKRKNKWTDEQVLEHIGTVYLTVVFADYDKCGHKYATKAMVLIGRGLQAVYIYFWNPFNGDFLRNSGIYSPQERRSRKENL